MYREFVLVKDFLSYYSGDKIVEIVDINEKEILLSGTKYEANSSLYYNYCIEEFDFTDDKLIINI